MYEAWERQHRGNGRRQGRSWGGGEKESVPKIYKPLLAGRVEICSDQQCGKKRANLTVEKRKLLSLREERSEVKEKVLKRRRKRNHGHFRQNEMLQKNDQSKTSNWGEKAKILKGTGAMVRLKNPLKRNKRRVRMALATIQCSYRNHLHLQRGIKTMFATTRKGVWTALLTR